MNGIEIRQKIDENNKKIRELLQSFILTPLIKELMKSNHDLKEQCPHHYINGACEYCYSLEKKNDKNN